MEGKPIEFTLLMNYQDQIVKDCIKWAEMNVSDKNRLQDFKAGVYEGMRQMVSCLKLHGHLVTTD